MRRKIPIRTCVACRTERPKKELARLVRTADGPLKWDPTGKVPGRGAYLCYSVQCLDTAVKRKALERALGCSLSPEQVEELRGRLCPQAAPAASTR